VNPRQHTSSARPFIVSKETHTVTPLTRLATRIASLRKPISIVSSSNSTPVGRGDSVTRGAAMASAGPSEARTQGGGVAALLTRLRTQHRAVSGAASVVLIGAGAFLATTPAQAATPAPAWLIQSVAGPTNFSPTYGGNYTITAIDVGSLPTDGSEVILTDTLPPALKATSVGLQWFGLNPEGPLIKEGKAGEFSGFCTTTPVRCAIPASFFAGQGPIRRDDELRMFVSTTVNSGAEEGPLLNEAAIEGGGAARVETSAENQLVAGLPPFGIPLFDSYFADPAGKAPTQAGEHPYGLTTTIALAIDPSVHVAESGGAFGGAVEEPRDVLVDLPPGLAGSALSATTCTYAQFGAATEGVAAEGGGNCPAGSQVGSITTHPDQLSHVFAPIYNMTPEHGVAAQFAFPALFGPHVLNASLVPSPAGYVLRVTSPEATQIVITEIISSIYGDPAARDAIRPEQAGDVPTFTNPADCNGEPLVTTIHTDSWQNPGSYNADGSPNLSDPAWKSVTYEAPPVSGCEALAGLFKPQIEALPTTNRADSPTGLDVNLKVPQAEGFETLGTPPLKKAVVTLPEGMTVNPSSANGLQGCSLAQIGVSAAGQPDAAPPHCPDASKIGSVELETPALPGVLEGQIYVAKQTENPFGSLLALYIVVNDPKTGVIVKLPGEIRADPATGQLTTVVDNTPQFPFEELKTHFLGGTKAALRTPAVCGTYKVTSELTPWSAPQSGPPAEPSASFEITQGCAKSAAAEPNQPSFEAGTVSPIAGTYSPFALKLHREDASQELKGLNVSLPAGLIGKLAGVGECSEPQLAAARSREHEGGGGEELASPSCPALSEVGTVTVGAGAGLTPYYAQGHAYLTGPYKGAPLGLAIITPAVAGPFDLGTVVVRAALQVNPETTQITAVSDPIPTILDGIPLDLRSIALQMSRHEFTLNPTNCEKKAVTGEALSLLGQTAPLSNPFQVGGCKALKFKPQLKLSLKGSVKRTANPKLIAALTMRPGEANIAFAQVRLPASAFLDNAHIGAVCTRVQFTAAAQLGEGCPAASVYGHVQALTPLLGAPLKGNVYLRANPAHKLPDLVAALNGQIEVALAGKTDSVKGALRNTFEMVPDAPVSSFRLELFGAKRGLIEMSTGFCAHPNAAVRFIGQNGKVYDTTPSVASSCPKKHKASHKHKGAHK
jgi:hypothetical protein